MPARIAALVAVVCLSAPASAGAFSFQTPSHNIACIGTTTYIRCDTRFQTKYSTTACSLRGHAAGRSGDLDGARGSRIAWFEDPDGNVISLQQPAS